MATEGPLRGDSLPRRSTAVAWQVVDGEMVLLRHKEKELLGLNPVGRRVWEMADGVTTIDQMSAAIAAHHGIPLAAAREDVDRFVRELMALGAVELHPR